MGYAGECGGYRALRLAAVIRSGLGCSVEAVVAVDDGTAVVADSGVRDSGVVLVEQALPYLRGCEIGFGEEPGTDQRPY
jgi:hypothetical protein